MPSITSLNSVFILAVPGVINAIQLQGFAADDIFTVDPLEIIETMMGIDGILSAGLVAVPVKMGIHLQADSTSNAVFDAWYAQMQKVNDVYFANANVTLTSINQKYALTKGVLVTYPPLADAAKTLRPRKYTIVWQAITPAVIAKV